MNELYELLTKKLQEMRTFHANSVDFDFQEVSQLFQFVCFMKQVKELVNWGEKDA